MVSGFHVWKNFQPWRWKEWKPWTVSDINDIKAGWWSVQNCWGSWCGEEAIPHASGLPSLCRTRSLSRYLVICISVTWADANLFSWLALLLIQSAAALTVLCLVGRPRFVQARSPYVFFSNNKQRFLWPLQRSPSAWANWNGKANQTGGDTGNISQADRTNVKIRPQGHRRGGETWPELTERAGWQGWTRPEKKKKKSHDEHAPLQRGPGHPRGGNVRLPWQGSLGSVWWEIQIQAYA